MSSEIGTARLLLRPWREEDLGAYARMYADPEVMRYLPAVMMTREQSEEQVAGSLLRGTKLRALGNGGQDDRPVYRLYRACLS